MDRRPLAALLVLLTACSPPDPALMEAHEILDLAPGDRVTVQLRRDHLGMSDGLPAGPELVSKGGKDLAVTGSLVAISPEWIVVDDKSRRNWIPRSSVLLLSTSRN